MFICETHARANSPATYDLWEFHSKSFGVCEDCYPDDRRAQLTADIPSAWLAELYRPPRCVNEAYRDAAPAGPGR